MFLQIFFKRHILLSRSKTIPTSIRTHFYDVVSDCLPHAITQFRLRRMLPAMEWFIGTETRTKYIPRITEAKCRRDNLTFAAWYDERHGSQPVADRAIRQRAP